MNTDSRGLIVSSPERSVWSTPAFANSAFSLWSWLLISSATWVALEVTGSGLSAGTGFPLTTVMLAVLLGVGRVLAAPPPAVFGDSNANTAGTSRAPRWRGVPRFPVFVVFVGVGALQSLAVAMTAHLRGSAMPTTAQSLAFGIPGITVALVLIGLTGVALSAWRLARATRLDSARRLAAHMNAGDRAAERARGRLHVWFHEQLQPFLQQDSLTPEQMRHLSATVVRPASHALAGDTLPAHAGSLDLADAPTSAGEAPMDLSEVLSGSSDPEEGHEPSVSSALTVWQSVRCWARDLSTRWQPPSPTLTPVLLLGLIGPALVVSEGWGPEVMMLITLALALWLCLQLLSLVWRKSAHPRSVPRTLAAGLCYLALAVLLPPTVRAGFLAVGIPTADYFPLPSVMIVIGLAVDTLRTTARLSTPLERDMSGTLNEELARVAQDNQAQVHAAAREYSRYLHGTVQSTLLTGAMTNTAWQDIRDQLLTPPRPDDPVTSDAHAEWAALLDFWSTALPLTTNIDPGALRHLLGTPASAALLFDAVTECLTNALKHTDASRAHLGLQGTTGAAELTIASGATLGTNEVKGSRAGLGYATLRASGLTVSSALLPDQLHEVRVTFPPGMSQ